MFSPKIKLKILIFFGDFEEIRLCYNVYELCSYAYSRICLTLALLNGLSKPNIIF